MEPEVVDVLHRSLKKALDDELCQAIVRRWELPNEYLGPQEYLAFAQERVLYERDMVRRLNLSID
jgi:tripartite-type tricarboxylate transporter receptor subunit TctC